MDTVTLYRPVGPKELELIEASGWRAFPPRLPEQPIFYPVLSEEYATLIARDWNVKASGAGFVTRFRVSASFVARYRVETVGSSVHKELWVPAEELAEFNRHIVGAIEVIAEFRRQPVSGSANEVAQFATSYDPKNFNAIAFAWNGKHAEQFADANADFRRKVIDVVLAQPDAVPIELIRDLYTAETEYSREAWAVLPAVSQLAELLLIRGSNAFLDQYANGMGQGFDAALASRNISLPKSVAASLLAECEARLEDPKIGPARGRYQVLVDFFRAKLEP